MPYHLRTKASQDRLLVRIHQKARAFAVSVVNEDEVEDTANDVVLYCLEKLRSREWKTLPRNLQALIRSVVRARAASIIRRKKVQRSHAHDLPCGAKALTPEWVAPDYDWSEAAIADYQQGVMKKLPRRCRAAYELVRLYDFSYEETAQCMGVSTRAVGNYIVKANRVFRDELRLDGVHVRLPDAGPTLDSSWRNPDDVPFAPPYAAPKPDPVMA